MCLHTVTKERSKATHYKKSEASHLLLLFVEPFCRSNNIEYKYVGLPSKEDYIIADTLNKSIHDKVPIMEFKRYRDLMVFLESFYHAFEPCNDRCKQTVEPAIDVDQRISA